MTAVTLDWRVARLAIGGFPDWPIWDERLRSSRCYLHRAGSANIFLGPSASKGKKRSPCISHTRRGWSHRVDEQDRVASRLYRTFATRRYTRTRSSYYSRNDSNPRNGCSSCCGSDGVMALGVVADRTETSRWVLLSSPLSPGQTGEQIQTTTNAYTYPRALVRGTRTRGILALLVGVVEAAPPPSWVLGGFPDNPGYH